ncbi:FG-GAP-like repeat-containing protein [Gemmata sp. JC673]|uniref:FG-GAP-like repeat-containing protein n=1 Tax=Gemmata algarum TaxID=2975278 RepID=A0ABU5F8F6_9BACT|nr:FG-GAP-like repeat-containing protein [Gemmata algarum]MDY3562151.1 FG-GAP-like repeat-containing protein [Gemmata algarum]
MPSPRPQTPSARLRCEPLEDRLTPAFVPAPTTGPSILHFEYNDAPIPSPFGTLGALEAPGSSLTVNVYRDGGADDAVSVKVTATGLTATAGADFVGGDYTVSFAPGQRVATVQIPIIDDGLAESTEELRLTMSAPTGGAQIDWGAVTARIVDGDAPLVASAELPAAPGGETSVRLASANRWVLLPAELTPRLVPFAGYGGAVSVALGDVNRDGTWDVIAAATNGHVKVLDGRTGAELRSFLAYTGYTGAVRVAAGDVDGDGYADLITGATLNGHVKVFSGATGAEARSFLAYPGGPGLTDVAAGDVDGDGRADIITGAAINGHVKVFGGATGTLIRSFLAYEGYNGGMFLAAGDVDGDGYADLITGAALNGHVKAFDGRTGVVLPTISVVNPDGAITGIAATDLDNDGRADIAASEPRGTFSVDGGPDGLLSDGSITSGVAIFD